MINYIYFIFLASYAKMAFAVPNYPYERINDTQNIEQVFEGIHKGLVLDVALGIDSLFTDRQKELVKIAFSIFFERSLKDHIIRCAFDNAIKDMPSSRQKFKNQLLSALTPLFVPPEHSFPSLVYVAKYDSHESVGLGFLNLFYDTDKPFPGFSSRHYLHIALNSDYLTSKNYSYGNDSEYWAGVIAHEILHNLNYHHPNGYPGSFITEFGNCVWSDGTGASMPFFNDIEILKQL